MLSAFIDGLPGESLTKTAIRDAIPDEQLAELADRDRQGHGPWSHEALLSAAALDVLRTILYVLIVSKGGKSKPPEPYPRPGVVAKRRRLTPEGRAYLMRLRSEHARVHGYDIDGEAVEAN